MSAPNEKLAMGVKLAFGAPGFAGAALVVPISLLMPQFYSDVVGIPLGYVAIAIAVARSVDALTDPLMGWITDRTKTRFGRRKPWIAAGVPLTALTFYLLFSPPETLSSGAALAWFGLTFGLYFVFSTIYQVPHAALGAEVTLDYAERSSLFSWQTLFVQTGLLGALLLSGFLSSAVGPRAGYSAAAAIFAVLLVVLYAVLLWHVPERPEFIGRASNPLVPGVRRSLRNRPFRILFFAGLVNSIPAAIPALLLRYHVTYVLEVPPDEVDTWVAVFIGIFILVGLAFIPVWLAVANRFGKLRAFVAAATIGIVGSALFFFAGPGDTVYFGFVFFVVGIQSAAQVLLLPAIGADAIDYDELLTGKRREAQFGALLGIIPKFVSIPGSAIPLAILAFVGYVPNQPQTETVVFTIRFLYGLFPIAFYVVSLSILARYPISAAAHGRIRAGIAAHGAGEPAIDPLTGRSLPPTTSREVPEQLGWFLDHFSIRELRRAHAGHTHLVVTSVVTWMALSLGAAVAAAAFSISRTNDLTIDPGPGVVVSVVASGLALTLFFFHLLRLRPALALHRDPPDPSVLATFVEAHRHRPRATRASDLREGGNASRDSQV